MSVKRDLLRLLILISHIVFVSLVQASVENGQSLLAKQSWLHGAKDCTTSSDPAYDSYQYSKQTFILRQSKCLSYEAPFIYVLMGRDKLLVLDTGALDESVDHSLYAVLEDLLGKEVVAAKEMLVIHTHGHRDHYRGDYAFANRPKVTLVKPSANDVEKFFGFSNWPEGRATLDLGGRALIVMPTPGHQEEAITVYDPQTQWLLTGDTVYPGVIYVKDWPAYRDSIRKLAAFAAEHKVAAIMGAHIEMKQQAGTYYPVGSTYQPDEASLDLPVQDLRALAMRLDAEDVPQTLVFDTFIIEPMGYLQKTLSNVIRWFSR